MMLGTWGPLTFQASADKVRTWQAQRRSGEARWHKHEVHLGKPRPEFLGPGDDTIQMEVRLDSQLGLVPNDELESLRRERDAGEWHDDHPLNRRDTASAEWARLFGE